MTPKSERKMFKFYPSICESYGHGHAFLPLLVSDPSSVWKQLRLLHRIHEIIKGNHIHRDPRTLLATYAGLNGYDNNNLFHFILPL